jgi:tRNA (cytosine38-C5)-methyltransferase
MPVKIIAAVDINENANLTYKHNFPDDKCLNNNIQKLKMKDFQDVSCILMSPPCQPFTRNGNFKDVDDRRSDAFHSVCSMIEDEKLPQLSYILMENVMGFEKSQMRDVFVKCLKSAGFHFQEFIISPTQIGVANTRHRYYCIARKAREFSFASADIVSLTFDEPPIDTNRFAF